MDIQCSWGQVNSKKTRANAWLCTNTDQDWQAKNNVAGQHTMKHRLIQAHLSLVPFDYCHFPLAVCQFFVFSFWVHTCTAEFPICTAPPAHYRTHFLHHCPMHSPPLLIWVQDGFDVTNQRQCGEKWYYYFWEVFHCMAYKSTFFS